jgi:hypothetical protein
MKRNLCIARLCSIIMHEVHEGRHIYDVGASK